MRLPHMIVDRTIDSHNMITVRVSVRMGLLPGIPLSTLPKATTQVPENGIIGHRSWLLSVT